MSSKKHEKTLLSKMKWEGMFKSPNRGCVWNFCIIMAILLVIICAYYDSQINVVYYETAVTDTETTDIYDDKTIMDDRAQAESNSKSPINSLSLMLVSLGLSLSSGIIGAAVLNLVYRLYTNNTIRLIKSLHYDDMLTGFFGTLEVLKGRVRKNEEIRAKFDVYTDKDGNIVPELYKITLDYEFYTILKGNQIKCKFDRIYNSETSNKITETGSETDTKNNKHSLAIIKTKKTKNG